MGVSLTVCGSAGTHPGPARSCSSYLVHAGDDRLVLDLGNGSLRNLMQRCDVADLDAVILSHLHPDHCVDIYGLYYALRFHPSGSGSVDVYGPSGGGSHLAQILGDPSEPSFYEILRFRDAAAGDVFEVGAMTVRLFAAEHPVTTIASRIEVDGKVLAFTGDSAPTTRLVECAQGADVLLADATWQESDRPLPAGIHMTGREAGDLAAAAGVTRLVLTHILPTNDPAVTAAEAAEAFDGEILLATDLLELTL